jgi:hypothetical protein
MNRYSWIAINRDGSVIQRWNSDGTQNLPKYNETAEFHLLPSPEGLAKGLKPFSLFLTKDQRLIFKLRTHHDATNANTTPTFDQSSVVYIVGYEEDQNNAYFSSYCALLPDGRVEWSHDLNHITMHERNLDVHPLKFYETYGV